MRKSTIRYIKLKNGRVNWRYTITTFRSWKYAIIIHHIGDIPSEYIFPLLRPTHRVMFLVFFPYERVYSSIQIHLLRASRPQGRRRRGTLQTFFNWYYTVLGLSIVFAATVIVYIQQARGWVVGFSVPSCSWSPRSRSSSSLALLPQGGGRQERHPRPRAGARRQLQEPPRAHAAGDGRRLELLQQGRRQAQDSHQQAKGTVHYCTILNSSS